MRIRSKTQPSLQGLQKSSNSFSRNKKTKNPSLESESNSQNTLEPNSTSHYTKFSSKIFKGDEYLPKFIKEVEADANYFKYLKCKDPKTKKLGKLIRVNGLQPHLNSEEHEINTPEKEQEKLEKAREKLNKAMNKDAKGKSKADDEQEVSNYLNVIAFMLSQNLSYAQTENILKYFQKAAKDDGLEFLKNFNFDQRLISKLIQNCLGPVLKQKLENKLSQTKYSLIVDNATLCGESFCAIKVKYLDSDWNEDFQSNITSINNKIIAISNLKENSSGKTLQNIVDTHLFQKEEVKKNFVGFVHDN